MSWRAVTPRPPSDATRTVGMDEFVRKHPQLQDELGLRPYEDGRPAVAVSVRKRATTVRPTEARAAQRPGCSAKGSSTADAQRLPFVSRPAKTRQ